MLHSCQKRLSVKLDFDGHTDFSDCRGYDCFEISCDLCRDWSDYQRQQCVSNVSLFWLSVIASVSYEVTVLLSLPLRWLLTTNIVK